MKNKKITYLLIAAVFAVWGIIFYSLFANIDSNEPIYVKPLQKIEANESLEDYKIKDTFILSLNYRDPMLGIVTNAVPTLPKILKHKSYTPVIQEQPIIYNDIIKFVGYIYDQPKKRMAAIVNLNGSELMLSEGESLKGLKVIKNYKDSIKIIFRNRVKFIRLE